jgi:hypothetical protein
MQCELWEVAFACGSKESEKEAALVITTCIKVILSERSRVELPKDSAESIFIKDASEKR